MNEQLATSIAALAIVCSVSASAGTAADPFDAKQCFFSACAVGDVVVTTPSRVSTSGCTRQGVTLYVAYVTREHALPDEQRRLAETQLRLEAGVRSLDEAMTFCHPIPAGQRAKVVEMGAYKTGLLRIAPQDGSSSSYWLSSFDVSRP